VRLEHSIEEISDQISELSLELKSDRAIKIFQQLKEKLAEVFNE